MGSRKKSALAKAEQAERVATSLLDATVDWNDELTRNNASLTMEVAKLKAEADERANELMDLTSALKLAQEEAEADRRAVRYYRRQIEALCQVLPD